MQDLGKFQVGVILPGLKWLNQALFLHKIIYFDKSSWPKYVYLQLILTHIALFRGLRMVVCASVCEGASITLNTIFIHEKCWSMIENSWNAVSVLIIANVLSVHVWQAFLMGNYCENGVLCSLFLCLHPSLLHPNFLLSYFGMTWNCPVSYSVCIHAPKVSINRGRFSWLSAAWQVRLSSVLNKQLLQGGIASPLVESTISLCLLNCI